MEQVRPVLCALRLKLSPTSSSLQDCSCHMANRPPVPAARPSLPAVVYNDYWISTISV